MKRSTSRDTANRHANVYARGMLSTIDDTMPMQIIGFGLYSQEQQSQIEHAEPYGYSSYANIQQGGGAGGGGGSSGSLGDQAGPEHFTSEINSGRSHGVAMHVPDRRYRLKNKQPGEVSVYDWQGQWFYLRAGSSSGSSGSGGGGGSSGSQQGGQMFGKVPNSFSIKFQIDKDQQQGGSSSGSGGSSGGSQQLGQDASQIPEAYAYHQIDKNSRTVQHPQLIQHQVTDSNGNPQHQVIIQTGQGITEKTQNNITHTAQQTITQTAQENINRTAQQNISDTAPQIAHNGNTNVTGNLNVSQIIDAAGIGLTSDRRLKFQIAPATLDAIDVVMGVTVSEFCKFGMKLEQALPGGPIIGEDTLKRHLGFIAQDVIEKLPQAVNANDLGILHLDPMPLIAALWKCVQQQQSEIAALKGKIG